MTQDQLALDLINWGVDVSFIVTVLFPFYIRIIWNWLDSDWGWNTIVFDIVVALALLPVWLHHTFGLSASSHIFLWVDATSIWAIPTIVIWRTWIIFRVQRHGE
jgi:hypothetical protein